MSSVAEYRWGVTRRRISDEGEAARKEALAWLGSLGVTDARPEVLLKRMPDSSGGLGVARGDDGLLGVAVSAGPTAHLVVEDGGLVRELLQGLAEGGEGAPRRIWCDPSVVAEVEGWCGEHGGVGAVAEHGVWIAHAAPDPAADGPGLVRWAEPADGVALEGLYAAYSEALGRTPTRDLYSALARKEVVVAEADGRIGSAGLRSGRGAERDCVDGLWTEPALRRRGLAGGVLRELLSASLGSRPGVQAVAPFGDEATAGLLRSTGFEHQATLVLVARS